MNNIQSEIKALRDRLDQLEASFKTPATHVRQTRTLDINGIVQNFVWIPPTPKPFLMGSFGLEYARKAAEQQHPVLLTRGFWLADTACTQALWTAVMGENPSHFKGEQRPVENVSWNDVQGFLGRLNDELAAFGGLGSDLWCRLPTEAEWEYACRAGTTGPFSFGDDITPEQANYDGNYPYHDGLQGLYREETVAVASLPPNAWGFYEMHGNVWEWCSDWYGAYPSDLVTDPVGPVSGEWRVLRGGSWFDVAQNLRSAYRHRVAPGYRSHNRGFRLALGLI